MTWLSRSRTSHYRFSHELAHVTSYENDFYNYKESNNDPLYMF